MTTKEKKFIDLKVLLSVQDIHELAASSRLYKNHGIVIEILSSEDTKAIRSEFALELSWLLFQLEYIFGNDQGLFNDLEQELREVIHKNFPLNRAIEALLDKAAESTSL